MFQLDLSKIKEAQTDESLKGTGKMPVYVLAFVYTLREKISLSEIFSDNRQNSKSNKTWCRERREGFCTLYRTDFYHCLWIKLVCWNEWSPSFPQIYSDVNGTLRNISVIRHLHFLSAKQSTQTFYVDANSPTLNQSFIIFSEIESPVYMQCESSHK